MLEPRAFKTEGIIIKRKNFGEANRILTIFTKRSGKIQIKAIGVRKITSRRSSHIELLNYSSLSLYKGKSLPILTEVQTIKEYPNIKNNLVKIGFAYHLCELIDGLCAENQQNCEVFYLFLETLERLNNQKDIVSIVHEFEVELLTILGFWPRVNIPQYLNTQNIIERILERKLKSKKFLSKLS